MSDLMRIRGNAKGCLTRAASFADSIVPATPLELLEIKFTKLNETWSEFSALHKEVLKTAADDTTCDEFEVEFSEYEEKFFNAHSKLVKSIRERQSVGQENEDSALEQLAKQQTTFLEKLNSTSEHNSKIHLPKLTVSPFSGNYKDWPSFRDSFMGTIEKQPNLSCTQKFHYLKSFLCDDAEHLIRHLPISDANYLEAWDRLEKRYDRSHLIVQSFIQMFVSLPSVTAGNVQTLRKVTDGADEVIRGLNALGSNSRDPWLMFLLLSKLDTESKQSWAQHVGSRDNCTFKELLSFLGSRCDAFESCQSLSRPSLSRRKPQSEIRTHFAESSQSTPYCPKCKNNHILPQCSQFTNLDIESRRNFVKSNSLCFNCLRVGHSANKCRSSFRCRVCKSRHHTLVHPPEQTHSSSSIPSISSSSTPSTSSSVQIQDPQQNQGYLQPQPSCSTSSPVYPLINNHSIDVGFSKKTILPTILATVQDIQGNPISCRVLLDSGSQVSFVVESFAQRLGLPRKHARVPILGVSSTEAGHTRGCISMTLRSRLNQTHLFIDAFILNKLTSNLPSQSLDITAWSHIQNLELADPRFNVPSPVDVLLGADKLWCVLKGEQIQGSRGLPIAQNTSFGWVVTGELLDTQHSNHVAISSLHTTLDVDVLLQRFWELDDVTPPPDESFSNDEAEQHFRKTFSRSSDGRYVVQLPFNTPSPVFGNSLKSAINRLNSMERRFQRDANLRCMYLKFMQEYIRLGHMVRIPSAELDTNPGMQFYLPHHAVLKPDSSTTKLRVVFDGSARDSFGNSLNSKLLIGPPIQRDLVGVCLRFRQHKYVFTADVVKMFRQIWVDDNHTDYQRIVWRENPSDEISHFRLRTITYGTASAPFLSVRVLKQIAMDYQSQYPNAARILLRDVYVDDIMTGANSSEELIRLQSELVTLLSLAKLELRKWNSNCWPLLVRLPQEDCEFSWFDTERSKSLIKVLGMHWNPTSDQFSFRMADTQLCTSPTRRTLLSEIARIFDPLGFLAPSVILFKLLFQELWSSELRLSWDDPLPLPLADRWTTYQRELHFFEQIRIARNVFSSFEDVELHGFSDASSVAYSAVVYARCKIAENQFKVVLIAAKTKVAPLKPVSIPRLELCGALLLYRLINLIKTSISYNFKIFAWCDSEIVLHWLSSPPRRWTTFVANRVAAILEQIPRYAWNYIASESNPADCASRGVLPSNLINHHLWWTGPSWLSLSQEFWPASKFTLPQPDPAVIAAEEKQAPKQVLISATHMDVISSLILKISSWSRLLRIFAYCRRFITYCRPNQIAKIRHGRGISLTELKTSRLYILKHVQQQTFGSEIRGLMNNRGLPNKSKLIRYYPFIDNDGLLRVGGRIKNSNVSYNIKHPIILPNTCVSSLIATEIHTNHLHPGVSEAFAIVRQQYWMLGSRNLIRKIVHTCKPCFLQRKATSSQLMGDLPQPRVIQSRPFANTGCDYAGPFTIKLSKGRNPKLAKAYLALFVCMCTKAMHLELVSDLTTDAFLAAFRRFVSRRGKCSNIYTDNGTNFQGARRCLNDMQKLVLSQTYNDDIAAALALDGVEWHFIPPSAPHFGGLWESGVKSVKLHLRRVIGSNILTFEELYTVLTQIESILNSRPLCVLSDEDCNPLTPAHFLIGEPFTAVPEPSYLETSPNRLSHWNHLQSMVQGFWRRWQSEYVTTLQERPKWKTPKVELKIGDIVVIKEPNLPPTKWLLGRIEATHPGSDNRVRVATVRTARGNFTRPITKLAVLPSS